MSPEPQDDDDESCIMCWEPTDTTLSFRGPIGWLAAILVMLGIPREDSYSMVSCFLVGDEMVVRACPKCAARCPTWFPKLSALGHNFDHVSGQAQAAAW